MRHCEGPLLILAGPGSGKTRVIVHRIAWLVRSRIAEADNILGITFTNKAANEMRHRLTGLLGNRGPTAVLSTYHSFCARMLRADGRPIHVSSSFVVFDSTDQLKAVRLALDELRLDKDAIAPRSVLWQIGQWKNHMLTPEQLAVTQDGYRDAQIVKVFAQYEKILRRCDALDFDDLLLRAVSLLRQHGTVLEKYTERYRYVLVDEYQDTNHAQYELTLLLAQKHRNVCAVGDPDQAIYGWRGADIENIHLFEEDFPERKVVNLERNYRSSGNIVGAAAALIARNDERADKTLWTGRADGAEIQHVRTDSDQHEARMISKHRGRAARPAPRGRGPLPHERAVTADRGRNATGRNPVPHRRKHPVLRAEGDQGRARLPEGHRQPPRRRQPAADHQLTAPRDRTAQHREGRRRAGQDDEHHRNAVRTGANHGRRESIALDPPERRLREAAADGRPLARRWSPSSR